MSGFQVFGLYLLVCWLVIQWRSRPLQPDQLVDDLGELDMADRNRQLAIRESNWWDDPIVNVKLSRRG